jgi:hypothetical protein
VRIQTSGSLTSVARRPDAIAQDVEFAVLERADFALLDYRKQRREKRWMQSDITALQSRKILLWPR